MLINFKTNQKNETFFLEGIHYEVSNRREKKDVYFYGAIFITFD